MDLLIKQFIIISVFITYSIIYGQINIVEAFPNLSFTIPLDLQHAPDGSDRIFVVEKQGHIYVFENDPDVTEKTLFLDISDSVSLEGDLGLHGLAFHPDFANNGYFFVNYTKLPPWRTVISRFEVSANNPNQADRDALYKTGVNPIVTFPGSGTVLYGDKTLQTRPSAFDRINVRRLFIVLEKAISTASKASLFEFNDEFTRAQFRNMVEPFLRDVKGRRGITDFKVVCDGTNNTGNIIDTNKFVADIYVKPARSINYITLNFIATRTGVEFSEIAGGN